MKINNEYLLDCGFQVDVEMNLSVRYWKDDLFEIIDYTEVDREKDLGWDLIIFESDRAHGHSKLIAHVDDIDKVKKLLEIYDINPNNYFK